MLIPKIIDDTVFYRVNSYTIPQFHTQEWKTYKIKKHVTKEELAVSWFRMTGRENKTTSTQILQQQKR